MKLCLLLTTTGIAIACAVEVLPLALPQSAIAQGNPVLTNVIPESEAVTLQAKITAIDPTNRLVTLAGASGQQVAVVARRNVRLEMLKVGDRVNAKYYRSVGFVVNPPAGANGVPVTEDKMAELIARPTQAPGGVKLTKISGTVVSVDMGAHSVGLVNPSGGGIYTIDVTDPARIAMVGSLKVGDTVTAVISQALVVSIDSAPQSWF